MLAESEKIGNHYVGEQFANKRLLSYAGLNRSGHHTWLWECVLCNSEGGPSTYSHMKRSGQCKMGCNSGVTHPTWKGYEQLTGVWLGSYKWGAKKRGIEWNLTPEQIWAQWLTQQGRCAYTGWALTHGVDASLDRIDNSRGYLVGNIQWLHSKINKMKSDFTEDEFLNLCRAIL